LKSSQIPRMESNAGAVDIHDLHAQITKLQEELNDANKKIDWLLQNLHNNDLVEKFKVNRQIPETNDLKRTASQQAVTRATEEVSLKTSTDELSKKKEKARELVLRELIDTERDYVRDLELIIKAFYNPLEERSILSKEDMSQLFSNIPVLVQVNKQLLEDFENRAKVENIAVKMAGLLKMYTNYCANQNIMLNNLERIKKSNDKFAHFLHDAMENPDCRGLGLNAYLIKPVQRLCKYPLLFRELIKNTPEDSPEYAQLANILKKISESVDYVNERTRQVENQQKIIEISNSLENAEEIELVTPSRRFVAQHEVGLLHKKKKKPRPSVLFVFNDLVLLAKPNKNKYTAKHKILMKDLRVIEVPDTDDGFIWEIQARNVTHGIKLVSSSEEEKKKVTSLLKTLLRDVQKKEIQVLKSDSFGSISGSSDSVASSPASPAPAPLLAENRRRRSVENGSPLERQSSSEGPTGRKLIHSGSGGSGSWNFAKLPSSPSGNQLQVSSSSPPAQTTPQTPQQAPAAEVPPTPEQTQTQQQQVEQTEPEQAPQTPVESKPTEQTEVTQQATVVEEVHNDAEPPVTEVKEAPATEQTHTEQQPAPVTEVKEAPAESPAAPSETQASKPEVPSQEPSTPQKEQEVTPVVQSASQEKTPTPRVVHMDSATILKELVGITKPKKVEEAPKRVPRVKTMKITKSELEEYKKEEEEEREAVKQIVPNPTVTWSAGRSKLLLQKLKLSVATPSVSPSPRDPNKTYYSMNDLLQKEAMHAKGLDMTALETYLTPEEFFDVFGITFEDFLKLPQWKRVEAKKIVGLF